MSRYGYACINIELQSQKPRIFCSRAMIKRTFQSKGIDHASDLALQNVKDLVKIIEWNNENDVKVFRMTSCLFPWASEYEIEQLKDFEEIKTYLEKAGLLARENNQRLSFHPGPFNILASAKEHVIENSIKDLSIHGKILDLMGMPRSHWSKINIHVGGAYGDRSSSLARFCKNFDRLPENVKTRLTVENDDRPTLYSTKMLYEGVSRVIGVPIVFDSHHYECGPQDASYSESLLMAVSTWPESVTPQCHHSNSRKFYEDEKAKIVAHSDWYYKPFNDLGLNLDVVLEAKMKEKALVKYWNDFVQIEERLCS